MDVCQCQMAFLNTVVLAASGTQTLSGAKPLILAQLLLVAIRGNMWHKGAIMYMQGTYKIDLLVAAHFG